MSTSGLPLVKASKLIHIRSENKSSGSNENFRIDLKQPITVNTHHESIFLSLTSAIIPHSFYNVNSLNNSFQIQFQSKSNGAMLTNAYFVKEGFYTTDTFKDEIRTTLMNSKPVGDNGTSNFTVDLDPLKKTFKITYTSTVYRIDKLNYVSDMYKIFGFPFNYYANGNLVNVMPSYDNNDRALTTTSTLEMCYDNSPVNLSIVNELRVVINNLSTNEVYNNFSQSNKFILANILINTSPLSYIYFYPHYRNSCKINDLNFSYLDISLEDCFGNVIDLNNQNWSLCIRCDFRLDRDRQNNDKLYFLK